MKFTFQWLKTHLDTKASLNEIVDRLTMIGLELEGVEDRAKNLAPFVVAYQNGIEPGRRMIELLDDNRVLRMVLRQGMVLVSVGLGTGLVGATLLSGALREMLYEVRTTDPVTFVLVAAALAGIAAVSIFIPARRVISIDPMQALRADS